jgi:hypothetical protein
MVPSAICQARLRKAIYTTAMGSSKSGYQGMNARSLFGSHRMPGGLQKILIILILKGVMGRPGTGAKAQAD